MKKLHNLKWFLLGMATCILISSLIITIVAANRERRVTAELIYRDIKITLDGNELIPKDAQGNVVEPFIIDGTTYLPVRGISSALGLDIDWDGTTNTVILTTPSHSEYITTRGVEYSTDLTRLQLIGMNLTSADIEPLKYMITLTELDLRDNNISDISVLSGMTNLEILWLDINEISDINALSNLTNLKSLTLGSNKIKGIDALKNLINLRWLLRLEDNEISDISGLGGLINLTQLDLNGNQINNASPLANFANLTDLSLVGNQINDVSPLKGLTNLGTLLLSHNPLTAEQIAELREALPNTQIFADY